MLKWLLVTYFILLHFCICHINGQLDLLKSCSRYKVTFSSVTLGAKFEMFKMFDFFIDFKMKILKKKIPWVFFLFLLTGLFLTIARISLGRRPPTSQRCRPLRNVRRRQRRAWHSRAVKTSPTSDSLSLWTPVSSTFR